MKTLSTILIAGTLVSSVVMMGNKGGFNILGSETEHLDRAEEAHLPKDRILDAEVEINFNELFHIEKEMDLALDEIEYLVLEEEMEIEFDEVDEVLEPELDINFDEFIHVEDEVVLTMDEIEYVEMETE